MFTVKLLSTACRGPAQGTFGRVPLLTGASSNYTGIREQLDQPEFDGPGPAHQAPGGWLLSLPVLILQT